MKKLILVLLCLALVLPISACAYSGPVLLALPAENDDSYGAGYDAGYAAGYEAGYKAALAEYGLEPFTYDGAGLVWELTPESNAFYAIAYDKDAEMLAVMFRTSIGRAYVYSHFTEQDYNDFVLASTLGTYYNEHIKGHFRSHRIDDTEGTYFSP